MERYHATVIWEASDGWKPSITDDGTHFHLFCAAHVRHEETGCGGSRCVPKNEHVDHEEKVWGRNLPPDLHSVAFPGEES